MSNYPRFYDKFLIDGFLLKKTECTPFRIKTRTTPCLFVSYVFSPSTKYYIKNI